MKWDGHTTCLQCYEMLWRQYPDVAFEDATCLHTDGCTDAQNG